MRKNKDKKEYKVPNKKQPFFTIIKKILSFTIWRGIKLQILPKEISEKCIMVCNHTKKSGPMACELVLPVFNVKWGAHEMLGNYKTRVKYLRDIFYIKKQGYSKFVATIKAYFEAIFSKMVYKGIKLIGTYPDARLKNTLKNSVKVLEENKAILIFPENSNDGYHNKMNMFHPGFVVLSQYYYKLHNEDLPIYPIYYSRKQKKMVVGYPMYVQDYVKQGLSKEEISQKFCDAVNNLYYKHFDIEKEK